jgi:hypothetical protein
VATTGFVIAACATLVAAAADSFVPELEQRLVNVGVEQVNMYLAEQGSAAMLTLNRRTIDCELDAVSLAIRLSRSADAQAARAHGEALRAAVGRCTGFVLALVALDEVPRFCASVATWGPAQTARELRRRIAAIEANATLRASERGKSCRAAYLYELHNTRVVLKSKAAPAPAR